MIDSPAGRDDAAPVVACFDLDGVLVDSEATKIAAFRAAIERILRPESETVAAIDVYNRAHRGVPRREKFLVATEMATGTRDETAVQALLDAYAALLAERLPAVGAMPGAVEFTRAWPGSRALVTSAPRHEAVAYLRRLHFPPFDHIFDASTPKADALRTLSRGGQLPVVFFGDAQSDVEAAAAAGVSFVAVGDGIRNLETARVVARVESLADLLGKESELARSVLAAQ